MEDIFRLRIRGGWGEAARVQDEGLGSVLGPFTPLVFSSSLPSYSGTSMRVSSRPIYWLNLSFQGGDEGCRI